MKLARPFALMLGMSALLAAVPALAANPQPWQLNMTPGVTESSAQVYQLHMIILWICVVIGVLVFGAMAYAIFAFRKSKGAVPAKFTHNLTAEVIWTVIPVLILVAMAWPSTKVLFDMDNTSESEMTVKVTGYQWMWRYEILNYRGEATGVNFISRLLPADDQMRRVGKSENLSWDSRPNYLLEVDNPLVLPTDTKVRFVITADDVIHAWWVPALGWKQDAIPGVINEAWTNILKPGTYRGQCAELCGKDHGFMPIVIEARPRAEFEAWLASRRSAGEAVAARPAPAQAAAEG
jgi:cytochrome c oxidase subunit 2